MPGASLLLSPDRACVCVRVCVLHESFVFVTAVGEQVDAAMAASQEEACERGAAQEESELDRAIRLSREDEPLPSTMMTLTPPEEIEAAQLEALRRAAGSGGDSGGGNVDGDGGGYDGGGYVDGGGGDVWECSACTFHNEGDSTVCEICSALRPLRPPPPLPSLAFAPRAPTTTAITATTVTPEGVAGDSGGGTGGTGGGGDDGGGREIYTNPAVYDSQLEETPTAADGDEARRGKEARRKRDASENSPPLKRGKRQEMEREREGPVAAAAAAAGATVAEGAATGAAKGAAEDAEPPRVARKGPLRPRYELRAVLHHLGPHAFAGHYVTDVRESGGGGGSGGGSSGGSSGSGGSGGGGGSGGSGSSGVGSGSVVDLSQKNASDVGGGGGREGTGARGGAAAGRGGWKRYDDSLVAPVSEATALHGEARRTCYICFYALVSE